MTDQVYVGIPLQHRGRKLMQDEQSIRAIFFDLGGVIFQRDRMYASVRGVFEPVDPLLFWDLYNAEAMPLCRGEIDKHRFLQNLAARVGKQVPEEVLHNLCEERFHENRVADAGVISTIEALRKNYSLGLISNITEEFAKVAEQMGVFALFDEVLLSYQLGLSKDDETIFRVALDKLEVPPADTVFIDDYPLYTDVARSVGMRTIVFRDNIALRNELAAMGVSV